MSGGDTMTVYEPAGAHLYEYPLISRTTPRLCKVPITSSLFYVFMDAEGETKNKVIKVGKTDDDSPGLHKRKKEHEDRKTHRVRMNLLGASYSQPSDEGDIKTRFRPYALKKLNHRTQKLRNIADLDEWFWVTPGGEVEQW